MLKNYLKNIAYNEMAIAKPEKVLAMMVLNSLDEMGYYRTNQTENKINLQTDDEREIKKIIASAIPGMAISLSEPIMSKTLGGISNSFPTYEITLTKSLKTDAGDFPKGLSFKIANVSKSSNNGSNASQLGGKSLTPTELGLEDKKWTKSKDIKKAVMLNMSNKYNDNIRQFVEMLIDEITLKIDSKKQKINGIIDIADNERTEIILSDDIMKKVALLNPIDLNIIGKNLGEVLGGIYFFQKYSASNVLYPSQSNFPLIDFIVDDVVFVSAKYGAGAAPSIKVLADKYLENPKAYSKIDSRLKRILETIASASTLTSYLTAAEYMQTNIYSKMEKYRLVGETDRDTQELTVNFINKKFAQFGEDKDRMIEFLRKEFWRYAQSEPDINNVMEKIISGKKSEGAILYPLESELVGAMNADISMTAGLKAITKTMGVKQLYFDFQINKKKQNVMFLIKLFETKDFKFALTTSVNNYVNSNISFKMI